ncbi:unnamed protein product, partial [Closterium sp. NIES-64]
MSWSLSGDVLVCEERDALEDLLLQEQLKNRTPADKQLEEAKAHAAALELELRSMAARCEEWKRRAAQRAAEMNPAMVQALLEERLEDLDESGTIKIQMEVARLRDELAKSEVLRFELFRSTQEGAATNSKWEAEEEGLKQQMEEVDAGREINSKSIDEIPESTVWREANSMEEAEDLMQELLEMGQASLSQQDVERLSEAVESAERRAVEAERRAAQAEKEASEKAMQIRVLEAKLTALLGGDPSAIASAPYHHQALSSSSSLSSRPLPSTSTTAKSNVATATSVPTQVPTTTNVSASAATSSVHALANGITPRVSNTDDVAGQARDVSRRRADVARESAGRRESVLVIGSDDGASAVGKGIGGIRGVLSEVESSAGESKGESAEESGGDSLKELAAAQIADVEEIREIVHRVQDGRQLSDGDGRQAGGFRWEEVGGEARRGVVWWMQLSDVHVSVHVPSRANDLLVHLVPAVRVIAPAALIVSGDLTESKNRQRTTTAQNESEWCAYSKAMHALSTAINSAHPPSSPSPPLSLTSQSQQTEHTQNISPSRPSCAPFPRVLDLRGNHDAFSVPIRGGKGDFFGRQSVSAQCGRGGVQGLVLRPFEADSGKGEKWNRLCSPRGHHTTLQLPTHIPTLPALSATHIPTLPALSATHIPTLPALSATHIPTLPALSATHIPTLPALSATHIPTLPALSATHIPTLPALSATHIPTLPALSATHIPTLPALCNSYPNPPCPLRNSYPNPPCPLRNSYPNPPRPLRNSYPNPPRPPPSTPASPTPPILLLGIDIAPRVAIRGPSRVDIAPQGHPTTSDLTALDTSLPLPGPLSPPLCAPSIPIPSHSPTRHRHCAPAAAAAAAAAGRGTANRMVLVNGHLHWTFGRHLYRWHAVGGGGKWEGEGDERRGRQLGGRAGGGEERRSAADVGGVGNGGAASSGGAGVESGGAGLWEWEVGDWRSNRVVRILAHDPLTGLQFTDLQLLSPTLHRDSADPVTLALAKAFAADPLTGMQHSQTPAAQSPSCPGRCSPCHSRPHGAGLATSGVLLTCPCPMVLARQPVVLLTCPPNAHFLPPSQPKSAGAGEGGGEGEGEGAGAGSGEQVAAWVAGGEIRALVFSLPPILNVSAVVYREREPGGGVGGILGGILGGVGGKRSGVQVVRVDLKGESSPLTTGAEGRRSAGNAGNGVGSGKEVEVEIVEEVILTREEVEKGGNKEDGARRPSPLFWAAWDASRYTRPPFSPSSRLWLAVRVSYRTPPRDAAAAAASASAERGVSVYTSPAQPFTAFNRAVPFPHTWLERTIMGTDWEDLWPFAIVTPLLFLALMLLGSRALSYLIPPPSSHSSPSSHTSHTSHSSHASRPSHTPSPHPLSTTPPTVTQPLSSSPLSHRTPSSSHLQPFSSSLFILVKRLPSALLALLRLLLHIYLAASHSTA